MTQLTLNHQAIYAFYNATTPTQIDILNKKLTEYEEVLLRLLSNRSHFDTTSSDIFQLPIRSFDRIIGEVSIYNSKPRKRVSLVSTINKLCPQYTVTKVGDSHRQKVSLVKLNFNLVKAIQCKDIDYILTNQYGSLDLTDPNVVDLTPVDIKSLSAYIKWNKTKTSRNEALDSHQKKADLILQIAEATGGVLPQVISESQFGRRYYTGHNLQNCHKIVRQAALGEHVEYDINAAVYAIKLCLCALEDPEKKFTYTSEYLGNKSGIRRHLTKVVFGDTARESDLKKIKEALTAIGFGAKMTIPRLPGKEKIGETTTWTTSSLGTIFSYVPKGSTTSYVDKKAFKAFTEDPWVKHFVEEQNEMSVLLASSFKTAEYKITHPFLLDSRGHFSTNKIVSYLFQQVERNIMDMVEAFIHKEGATVKLRVHDAIFTDREIDLRELNFMLQADFVPRSLNWVGVVLGMSKALHDDFKHIDTAEEDDHRRRIVSEDAMSRALGYKSAPKSVVQHTRVTASGDGDKSYDSSSDYGYFYNESTDPFFDDMTEEQIDEYHKMIGDRPKVSVMPSFIKGLL